MFEVPGVLRGIHLLIFAIDFLEPPASISLFPPTFLSLAHWNGCDRGSAACLQFRWSQFLIPQQLAENPPTTTSRARGTESRASSLGKSSCMEGPLGWMLGCWRVERSSQSRPELSLTDSFIWASVYYSLAWPPSLPPTRPWLALAHFLKLRHRSTSALFSYYTMPVSTPFPSFSLLAGIGYLKWQADFKTDAQILLLFKHVNAHTHARTVSLFINIF